jgi:hypothetical protein
MKKKLQAIFAKLTEACKGMSDEEKKRLAESHKAALAVLESEAEPMEAEAWAKQGEGESDEDHAKRLHSMAKAVAAHLEPEKPAAEESEPVADPAEEPAGSADAAESKRDAISGLIKESGMTKDFYSEEDLARLNGLPYLEAKREITKDAKIVKTARESVSGSVASLHRGMTESGSDKTAAFCEAARKED